MVTIPALINKWQEKALVSQLKSTYSILARAQIQAVAENGPADTWDIGTHDTAAGGTKLYNYFKPYLKITKYCGTGTGCFATHYSALFNKDFAFQPDAQTSWFGGKAILANGASIFFYSPGTNCARAADNSISCGAIRVDVNGKNGPNKVGVDFFELQMTPNVVMPKSSAYYKGLSTKDGQTCQYKNTSKSNGEMCSGYVLKYGNMDYLRRDVSGDD